MLSRQTTFNLASNFLSVFRTREWDLLRSILSTDVSWSLPGSSLISGRSVGLEEVIKKAQRIVNFGVAFQLNHIFYGLNGMALSLHTLSAREQRVFDQQVLVVCTIRDERISELLTYMYDLDMFNEFCG